MGVERPVRLRRPTRVAILPVGFQHGFGVERPRACSFWEALFRWRRENCRFVRVNGQRAKIIGSVGASETILDVTRLKCAVGDTASFELEPLYARGFTVEFR